MQWKLSNQKIIISQTELLQQLFKNRELQDTQDFLTPQAPAEISISSLNIDEQQLKKAVKRIQVAIKNKEKVLIYGDYDADGITATSLVWLTLNHLGLATQPFIPDRLKHGYGMSLAALEEIQQTYQPALIITVDNGIVAHQELEWLKQHQIDVIVTDHHQPSTKKLSATAIVHTTSISGAGVAWMLMRELDQAYASQLLDLVAISTIADQMPLLLANRSFVYYGIEQLRHNTRPGLKALFQTANINCDEINADTIGFMIAPRINAAGRIAQGLTAARLLCTRKLSAAIALAENLEQLNQDRQDLTLDQYKIALQQVEQQSQQKLLIVTSDKFHEGVIGLLSGKLTEKFYQPSIAISTENKVVKASARSVKGVNITDLIRQVEAELLSVGGHELAAGFSTSKEKLPTVIQKLQELANQSIAPELLEPSLQIDALVAEALLNLKTCKLFSQLEPFGIANPQPILAIKNMIVKDAFSMGKDKQHLKLVLAVKEDDYQTVNAVGWNLGYLTSKLKLHTHIDLAFNLELNQWQGKESVQLKIKDLIFSS